MGYVDRMLGICCTESFLYLYISLISLLQAGLSHSRVTKGVGSARVPHMSRRGLPFVCFCAFSVPFQGGLGGEIQVSVLGALPSQALFVVHVSARTSQSVSA